MYLYSMGTYLCNNYVSNKNINQRVAAEHTRKNSLKRHLIALLFRIIYVIYLMTYYKMIYLVAYIKNIEGGSKFHG